MAARARVDGGTGREVCAALLRKHRLRRSEVLVWQYFVQVQAKFFLNFFYMSLNTLHNTSECVDRVRSSINIIEVETILFKVRLVLSFFFEDISLARRHAQ